jgi:RimJ/RimL family protein N-acetyltransferase
MGQCAAFLDKKGEPFEVRAFGPGDRSGLEAMYEAFEPKARFQGVPPSEKEACRRWIDGLVTGGENFLAWRGGRVIGHGVLLPDHEKGDAEYLIFVDRFHRGVGVGTAITGLAIERAAELGIRIVWLTVEAYNFRATRLYRKCGFAFCGTSGSSCERTMEYVCGCENGA